MSKNNYPNDWSHSCLKDLTQRFLNGGTPSTYVKEYWDGSIPWITGADAEQRLTTTSRKSVTKLGVKRSATNIVPRGNILLVTRTGVGKVSISGVDVAISQDLTGIIPNVELVDVPYLYYQLFRIAQGLQRLAQGSIIQGIKREEVEAIEIPLPEPAEQRVIADILSTVDEAIAQGESLVRKYQLIKQGLMFDLLTPKKNWQRLALGIACGRGGGSIQTGPFGSQLHSSDYQDEGVPIITVEHLSENGIIHSNLPLVGKQDYKRLQRYKIVIGDLVFSRVGAIDRCAYVSERENGWLFSGRCLRVRPGSTFDSRFLSYQLNHFYCRQWILNSAVGSTMKCLNTKILSDLPVYLPRIEEQKEIDKVLTNADTMNAKTQQELGKLVMLKQGLMQDLLSGQVRVKV